MRFDGSSFLVPPLAACLLSGCATIFSSTKAKVRFTSMPSGASVVAGDLRGTTPVTLELSKSTKSVRIIPPFGTVTASANGVESMMAGERKIQIDRELEVQWLYMELCLGPAFALVAGIVDGTTAAWYRLPGVVHCDFTKPEPTEGEDEAWFLHEPGDND